MTIEINSNIGNTDTITKNVIRDINNAIKSLPDGQISGRVLDIKNDIAQILTDQGQLINGKIQFENQLNIGDIRQFIVSRDSNGTILFSIIPENQEKVMETNIKSVLLELGINISHKNIEIAKALIQNNLPLSKENFQNVSRANILSENSKNNLNNAIFLLKNNIPVRENNIKILNEFTTNSFKLSSGLDNIQRQINNLPPSTLKTNLLEIINNSAKSIVLNKTDSKAQINHEANAQNTNIQSNKSWSTNSTISTNNTNITSTSNSNSNKENLSATRSSITTQENIILDMKNNTELNNTDISFTQNKITQNFASNGANSFIEELLKSLNGENKDTSVKETTENKDRWPIRLDFNNANLKDLDEHINETNKKIEALIKETLKYNTPESKALSESLSNIKERLLFTNTLKENFYIQIPLQLNKNETIELLVFKDRNKKKNKKNISSAIIGLDTVNLGRFETYIEKEELNVKLQFNLENENIIKLVKKNVDKLNELLKNKGLNISGIQYSKNTNNFNITTENINETPNNFILDIKM